ncbi:hypothetical protein GGI35DRAFT_451061 [Trichoderma velutinum]
MMSESLLDLYQILGVSRDVRVAEIRLAYRKQVLKHHPDKVQDPVLKAQKLEEFSRIQYAYETLTDEDKRSKYDDNVKLAELKKKLREENLITRKANYSRDLDSSGLGSPIHNKDAPGIYPQSLGRRFSRFFKRKSGGTQPLVAPSHHPALPVTSTTSSSPYIQEKRNDSRQSRFRRSSTTSLSHRNGSRGSRGSQNSTRSVSSQVSWEEMDKFDYILHTIDDLVGKHIKRLQGPLWAMRRDSTKSPKNQCKEILVSFQQSIRTYCQERRHTKKSERVKDSYSTVILTDHAARATQRTVFISDLSKTKGQRLPFYITCSISPATQLASWEL